MARKTNLQRGQKNSEDTESQGRIAMNPSLVGPTSMLCHDATEQPSGQIQHRRVACIDRKQASSQSMEA